eukprot:Nk52_evm4s289 gene=Nk52_evmTU4s289
MSANTLASKIFNISGVESSLAKVVKVPLLQKAFARKEVESCLRQGKDFVGVIHGCVADHELEKSHEQAGLVAFPQLECSYLKKVTQVAIEGPIVKSLCFPKMKHLFQGVETMFIEVSDSRIEFPADTLQEVKALTIVATGGPNDSMDALELVFPEGSLKEVISIAFIGVNSPNTIRFPRGSLGKLEVFTLRGFVPEITHFHKPRKQQLDEESIRGKRCNLNFEFPDGSLEKLKSFQVVGIDLDERTKLPHNSLQELERLNLENSSEVTFPENVFSKQEKQANVFVSSPDPLQKFPSNAFTHNKRLAVSLSATGMTVEHASRMFSNIFDLTTPSLFLSCNLIPLLTSFNLENTIMVHLTDLKVGDQIIFPKLKQKLTCLKLSNINGHLHFEDGSVATWRKVPAIDPPLTIDGVGGTGRISFGKGCLEDGVFCVALGKLDKGARLDFNPESFYKRTVIIDKNGVEADITYPNNTFKYELTTDEIGMVHPERWYQTYTVKTLKPKTDAKTDGSFIAHVKSTTNVYPYLELMQPRYMSWYLRIVTPIVSWLTGRRYPAVLNVIEGYFSTLGALPTPEGECAVKDLLATHEQQQAERRKERVDCGKV